MQKVQNVMVRKRPGLPTLNSSLSLSSRFFPSHPDPATPPRKLCYVLPIQLCTG